MENTNEIIIGDASTCTGCGACLAVCPLGAISMRNGLDGFLVPNIDHRLCSSCNLCRSTCPVNSIRINLSLNKADQMPSMYPGVYAAWSLDAEIRQCSSSGGVFSVFAEKVLEEKGLVVGAAFDDKMVLRHIAIDQERELWRLRGSKYVQSEISRDVYEQIKSSVEQKRKVLFSGTPCQVAGLRSYLKEDYKSLYCCDLVCMGVPSRQLLSKYFGFMEQKNRSKIRYCEFRNKKRGWKNPCVAIGFSNNRNIVETSDSNSYYIAFSKKIALRASCAECTFKGMKRMGDVTIGDFWGVADKYPQYDLEDKGTSLILVNTRKGQHILSICENELFLGEADLDTAVSGNPMLVRSAEIPKEREEFTRDLGISEYSELIAQYHLKAESCMIRFIQRGYWGIKKIGLAITNRGKRK